MVKYSVERYRSAQVGITNPITHNNNNCKQAIDYVSPYQLMDLIIGNIQYQTIPYNNKLYNIKPHHTIQQHTINKL